MSAVLLIIFIIFVSLFLLSQSSLQPRGFTTLKCVGDQFPGLRPAWVSFIASSDFLDTKTLPKHRKMKHSNYPKMGQGHSKTIPKMSERLESYKLRKVLRWLRCGVGVAMLCSSSTIK